MKTNSSGAYCISLKRIWILKDIGNCQLFHFIEGGLLRLPDQSWAQNSANNDQVQFSTSPCDDLTFVHSKEQFQYTQKPVTCIRFFDKLEPVLDTCDIAYRYKKEHVPELSYALKGYRLLIWSSLTLKAFLKGYNAKHGYNK